MQIGTKNIWFKPETESQKEKITNGFKELYKHAGIINCTKEDLSNLFLQQLELITKFPESKKIKCPKKPKSHARDAYGTNQRELWEHIRKSSYSSI